LETSQRVFHTLQVETTATRPQLGKYRTLENSDVKICIITKQLQTGKKHSYKETKFDLKITVLMLCKIPDNDHIAGQHERMLMNMEAPKVFEGHAKDFSNKS